MRNLAEVEGMTGLGAQIRHRIEEKISRRILEVMNMSYFVLYARANKRILQRGVLEVDYF